jgi:transposase
MRRYELTDEQRAVIEPLLPKAASGRPLAAPRQLLNAMFWVLRNGAPWRDLPERFGPW